MPYCPQCRTEYRAGTARCGECDVALVERLEESPSSEEMLDIYASYDQQQAERLRELLEEDGVEVLLRDRTSRPFPTNVGKTAQIIIAVPGHDRDRARGVIEAAIQDEVVAADGELL